MAITSGSKGCYDTQHRRLLVGLVERLGPAPDFVSHESTLFTVAIADSDFGNLCE
jgi:hypothetical protein